MKLRNKLFLPLSALIVLASAYGQTSSSCGALNLGFKIVTLSGVKTGVWYPTRDPEVSYTYALDTSSTLALNGTPADCARFPLVVFSHAYGGCGTQSLFFTEQLGRHGYIVAAPDHKDALCSVDGTSAAFNPGSEPSFFDPANWNYTTYADRKDDLEKVINGMLQSSDFGDRIDPAKIAVSGHSLGGYTAAGIVGGWSSWKDDRIKAALLLSPYILPFSLQNRLPSISLPVMYQGGQLDLGIIPFLLGSGGAYANSNAPKYLAELIAATHFEWTNVLCLGTGTVAACLQSKPNAQLIINYSVAFLDRYLNGMNQPLLTNTGSGLADYARATLLTTVSAASFAPGSPAAPESIVTGFGDALATATASAVQTPLGNTLAKVTAVITDSQGTERSSPLFFVSPGQINYLIPAGTASGSAKVSIQLMGKEVSAGSISIQTVAPGLFSARANGTGVAAAQFLRVSSDGPRTLGPIFDPKTLAPTPVDLGSSGDQIYLQLYGTGLRGGSAIATVGGVNVPVIGPVPQGEFIGLDQVNVGPLPHTLAGRGDLDIALTVAGQPSNVVTVNIR